MPASSSSHFKADRTVECKICGKLFPRGQLDLDRHMAAVTLKHCFSDKKTSNYHVGCKKCGTYFTSKEHYDMHGEKSSCNPVILKDRLEAKMKDEENFKIAEALAIQRKKEAAAVVVGKKRAHSDDLESNQSNETKAKDDAKSGSTATINGPLATHRIRRTASTSPGLVQVNDKSNNSVDSSITLPSSGTGGTKKRKKYNASNHRNHDDEHVTECLVCGKIFPRGQPDLDRHQNAATLQHKFISNKSKDYPYNCMYCSTYFLSKVHLQMHNTLTICGSKNSKSMKGNKNNTVFDKNGNMARKTTLWVASSTLAASHLNNPLPRNTNNTKKREADGGEMSIGDTGLYV